MELVFTENETTKRFGKTVLTLGNFDGVHRGHRVLLSLTVEKARRIDALAVAMIFDPHPVAFFKPDDFRLIQPTEEKLKHLEAAGLDLVIVQRFDRALAELSPTDFVQKELLERFDLREVVLGYDTTFGKDRAGTPQTFLECGRKYGFGVTVARPVQGEGQPISSSRIRKAVAAGDLPTAKLLLGYPFTLHGTVVHGAGRGGSQLGFPTANLEIPRRLLPPLGVYAAKALVDGKEYPAAVNVGTNPTFGQNPVGIEAHILDFHGDLYGHEMALAFEQRLRPEQRFSDLEELKKQMVLDMEEVRRALS